MVDFSVYNSSSHLIEYYDQFDNHYEFSLYLREHFPYHKPSEKPEHTNHTFEGKESYQWKQWFISDRDDIVILAIYSVKHTEGD